MKCVHMHMNNTVDNVRSCGIACVWFCMLVALNGVTLWPVALLEQRPFWLQPTQPWCGCERSPLGPSLLKPGPLKHGSGEVFNHVIFRPFVGFFFWEGGASIKGR